MFFAEIVGRMSSIDDLIRRKTVKEQRLKYGFSAPDMTVTEFVEDLPAAQRKLDEWCKDCKEYDHEKHCCPRFNRVISKVLDEAQPERWNRG